MRREYAFTSRWVVPAPVAHCWALLEESLRTGEVPWWPAVRVVPLPVAPTVGQVVRVEVRSPWGYRLHLALALTALTVPHLIAAESSGDLVGRGRLALEERGAAASALTWTWEVALTRPWMRIASPLLRPAFVAAHALVMRRGERGLREVIAERSELRNAGNPAVRRRRPRSRRYRGIP